MGGKGGENLSLLMQYIYPYYLQQSALSLPQLK